MTFDVTILGSSSATPAHHRNPASQVLNVGERLFLIDCGEATQIQISRYKIKSHRINHIFISHLHGDHYLGLMGLLSSFHLQGRTKEVHIFCHHELKDILELQLKVSESVLNFQIDYHFLSDTPQVILDDEDVLVETIKLNHRVPCMGFLFKEKNKPRHVIKEKIEEYKIPNHAFKEIKNGKDFVTDDGRIIKNEDITREALPPRSYAYCSDTLYSESFLEQIHGIDILYHEATFQHDLLPRALETYHTTSLQAGQIAKKAQVKKLLIGHFSARYRDLQPLLDEAKSVFENSFLALEGEKFSAE